MSHAIILEQREENTALIRWLFNPVPEGEELEWLGQPSAEGELTMQEQLAYYEAQEGLLEKAQQRVKSLEADLEETKRPLDAQMARLNASLIAANDSNLLLKQMIERIEAKAEAGLCASTFVGCREFLKDIRSITRGIA